MILELTAFRSYERAEIDWRPHELVVIAGPTGAGKSSLLDGICFALYGRTPETNRSADVLTLGREHGEVRLTFGRDGEVWRVTRRYGPQAPEPAQILERLAGVGGAPLSTIAGESEVSARVRDLVGLGFGAFTSAVVLAQGRFDQFLQAAPRDRDGILRELFGIASLERARAAAQRAESAAGARADALEEEMLRLPAHEPAVRTAAARTVRERAARRARLRALLPLAAEVRRLHASAAEAVAEAERLRSAGQRLPERSRMEGIAGQAARLAAEHAVAHAAHERARASAARAVHLRDEARRRHGGAGAELARLGAAAERLGALLLRMPDVDRELETAEQERASAAQRADPRANLGARIDALRAHAGARAALHTAETGLERVERERTAAHAQAREADGRARAAEEALAAARVADHAAVVRAALSAGDRCPVCGGTVGDRDHTDTDLSGVEARASRERTRAGEAARAAAEADGAHTAAVRRHRECAGALRTAAAALAEAGGFPHDELDRLELALAQAERAAGEVGRCEERIAQLRRERRACEDEVGRLRGTLAGWIEHADPERALARAEEELTLLEGQAEGARADRDVASQAARAAREAVESHDRTELAPLRQSAGIVAHLLDRQAPEPGLDAAGLVEAIAQLSAAADRAAADAEGAAQTALSAAETARERVAALAQPLGVASIGGLEAAAQRADDALAAARTAAGDCERAAAHARDLGARIRAARDDQEMHRRVGADLRADRFPRHLLMRYLTRLAAGASERLEMLSGGAFRFTGSGRDPLAVIDVRRGARTRPAGTLSGGERFLASLALALGLADIAAASGGRLECLFLDEGFSSLDAESLEQALEGIEHLAGDGRLVGVITHLPGVAERLGAAIHVRADPSGVSTVLATTPDAGEGTPARTGLP